MRDWKLNVPIAVLSFLVALVHPALIHPVSADTQLGTIDLDKYCREKYRVGGVFLKENSAYGWMCRTNASGGWAYIDMDEACQKQYKDDQAYAKTDNVSDKYSWRCYTIFVSASLGNPPPQSSGRVLATCSEDEDWGGTCQLRIESLGGRPERWRITATWTPQVGIAFADYMARELWGQVQLECGPDVRLGSRVRER